MSTSQETVASVGVADAVSVSQNATKSAISTFSTLSATEGDTRHQLLCAGINANVDDARIFQSSDSESTLPAIQKISKGHQNDNTCVIDKVDRTYTFTTVPVTMEEEVNGSETNPALSTTQTHGLSLYGNIVNKQTVCMTRKGSDGCNIDMQPVQSSQGCEEEETVETDFVIAAVAVEKILEGSELAIEYMQETEDEKKPNFGNADSLRFQNNLFELVEELRIRRIIDAENEIKMKQFMTEKYLLENKNEEAKSHNMTLCAEHTEQMAAVKTRFEGKMAHLREENARYASRCEASDKEMKLLKDEIRATQLSKYTLEKRLRELEQKLLLQTTTKDSHLSRLAELDTVAESVGRRLTDLTLQQGQLQKDVTEAEKLNRKLQYVNTHQTCLIDGYKTEIGKLRQDLMKMKVKLDQQPTNLHNQQLEAQEKVKILEDALNLKKDSVALLTRQLSEKISEHEKTMVLLTTAHSLVEKHVNLSNHNTQVAKNYCDTIDKLSTQLTSLKADYDVKCQQQDIETQTHEKTVTDWKTQHQSLSCQLKILQEEHEALLKHEADLENVNTQWAKKNLALVGEIKHMKDVLNKPKSDVSLQTEVDISDVALQTELEVTETHVQTHEIIMADVETQMDQLTYDMNSSQTEQIASIHQFTQTDAYNAEDRKKGQKDETDLSTQIESHVLIEPTLTPTKSHAPRLDISDHQGKEAHSTSVVNQKNSHQLEADKCNDVMQSACIVLPVTMTGIISATGDMCDISLTEVDTKRRRLSEAQQSKTNAPSHRYTFQFLDFLEPTTAVAPPVVQLAITVPKGSDAQPSETKSPVGILHDPTILRRRPTKRVTFMRESDIKPPGCSTVSHRTVANVDQLQKHWENIQEAFANRVQAQPPDTGLPPVAFFDENDDTILFSDDEPAGFELGSQVERIEHFLLTDRLTANKGHTSKFQ